VTDIYIEDVRSKDDLRGAVAAILAALEGGRIREVPLQVVCGRADGPTFSCEVVAGPVPGGEYVPCPDRGTHLRLTDCWRCWADVMRGADIETEVLTDRRWEDIVEDLRAGGLTDVVGEEGAE
jgi:hypothetical protein